MDIHEQQRLDLLYEQHLTNLTLQGKRPATIDAYSRAIRRIATYFDCCPDPLRKDRTGITFIRYTQDLKGVKHCHGSDRWRHGCRRRALRDEFMASHWSDSA